MRRIALIFLLAIAVTAVSQANTTLHWQGGSGDWNDLNWTRNGVIDTNALDDQGDNYVDYTDFDFTFDATTGNINKRDDNGTGGLTKLVSGSWTQSAGKVTIQESGAWSIALRAGTNGGLANAATITLSGTAEWDFTSPGKNSKAMVHLDDGSTVVMSDSASITLTNATAGKTEGLYMEEKTSFTMKDNATLNAASIKFNHGGSTTTFFTFESGTITLSSNNCLRTPNLGDPNSGSNRINFTTTQGSGAAKLINTDNTGTTLASKLATGFFNIDGVIVTDLVTEVNGYHFDIDTVGTTDTLTIVPEPATIALLGLGGLLLRRKRS